MPSQKDLTQLLMQADEAGIRLEIVGGLPLWEAHPVPIHQMAIDRIRRSIKRRRRRSSGSAKGCACIHLSDVYVRFPDGSLKRPDISIFCTEPEEEEEAVTLVPEAVVEIISKGYEAKDLEIGPHFYLSQGVKDVIVFDPHTLLVLHLRREKVTRQFSPVKINLVCGCRCTV